MTQLSSRATFANVIRALSMDAVQQANSGIRAHLWVWPI
jgi:transketolase